MVFPISFMICIENRNQQPPVKNQTNVDRFVNSEALKSEDFSDVDETITYRLKKGDASKTSLSDCLYESEREIVSNSREQVYLNWLVAGGSLNENQLRDSFRCLSLMVTPLETQNCSSSCTNAIKIVAKDRSCGCETMQSKAKDFNGLDLSIEKDISHCSLRCDEAFDEKLILHCMDKYPPLDHHPDHLSSSTRKEIQAQSCTLRADESIKSTVPRTLADWTRAIKKTISEKIADLNSEHREIFMSPISPNLDSAKLLVDDIPPFRVRLSLRDVTVKTEMVDRIHRRLYDALAVLKGVLCIEKYSALKNTCGRQNKGVVTLTLSPELYDSFSNHKNMKRRRDADFIPANAKASKRLKMKKCLLNEKKIILKGLLTRGTRFRYY